MKTSISNTLHKKAVFLDLLKKTAILFGAANSLKTYFLTSLFKNKIHFVFKSLLFLFLLLISTTGFAQNEFITIWKTDNPGLSDDNQIIFPATGSFSYEWQGLSNSEVGGPFNGFNETIITFPEPGKYLIKVTPNSNAGVGTEFHRFHFSNNPLLPNLVEDELKLINITQWGNIAWSSFKNIFCGANNLEVIATDLPNLNNVTDMSYAFAKHGFSGTFSISNLNE